MKDTHAYSGRDGDEYMEIKLPEVSIFSCVRVPVPLVNLIGERRVLTTMVFTWITRSSFRGLSVNVLRGNLISSTW